MEQKEIKNYIKSCLSDYLQETGRDTRRFIKCINPDHDDSTPSMKFDESRDKLHCFGCAADLDIFDVIGIDHSLKSFDEQYKKALELFQVNALTELPIKEKKQASKPKQEDLEEYFEVCHRYIVDTNYWKLRGLSIETVNRFRLGLDKGFVVKNGDIHEFWKALIIPNGPGSFTARNTDPDASKDNRIRKHGPNLIFNRSILSSSSKPIFVVEGEIDAMSVIEAGGEAIALGSTSNSQSFLRMLETTKPNVSLILALDNDEEGKKTSKMIDEELTKRGINHYTMNIAGIHKDANEALMADRARLSNAIDQAEKAESINIEVEKKEYLKTSAKYQISNFKNTINESVNTPKFPTGFPGLDDLLDGGLYEGLYIFGAVPSLGKTTFITQIADQVAQNGNDVLIFSLEMASSEIIAKSISRITLLECEKNTMNKDTRDAKTARGITDGKRYKNYSVDEKKLITESIKVYEGYADRIFISEGVGDIDVKKIRDMIINHIKLTDRTPVVIIDYIQILSPYSDRMSDKQNTDKAVLELKRISRDFKLPLIGISSFNRTNYSEQVSMSAFKESGAIEYSSDVLIGLQYHGVGTSKDFDVDEAREKNPRQIELKILKNRNGMTGSKVFDYYPYFNYFKESKALPITKSKVR